jgi:hypothetical protein
VIDQLSNIKVAQGFHSGTDYGYFSIYHVYIGGDTFRFTINEYDDTGKVLFSLHEDQPEVSYEVLLSAIEVMKQKYGCGKGGDETRWS